MPCSHHFIIVHKSKLILIKKRKEKKEKKKKKHWFKFIPYKNREALNLANLCIITCNFSSKWCWGILILIIIWILLSTLLLWKPSKVNPSNFWCSSICDRKGSLCRCHRWSPPLCKHHDNLLYVHTIPWMCGFLTRSLLLLPSLDPSLLNHKDTNNEGV